MRESLDISALPPGLEVGTSSFSSKDWIGPFYPPGIKPADFLIRYSEIFNSVEIDATWHAMPDIRTVEGWDRKTPDGFTFALKVPKVITHKKELDDCGDDWLQFLKVLEPLGDKRGPLLFQFPYCAKGRDPDEYETGDRFMRRLEAFLPLLPEEGRYVVEVRNQKWLGDRLLDLLKSRGMALCLPAYYTMPDPDRLRRMIDPVTAPFSYVRFLGHHRKMDEMVKKARQETGNRGSWDRILVDRSAETRAWIGMIRELLNRPVEVYAFFNNHYAGFGPGSAALFLQEWQRTGRA